MAKATKTKNGTAATVGYEAELWRMADALRGSMDAAEYKHVVLGLIFLKYISDAFQAKYAALEMTPYADPEDRDEYAAENIFWVPAEARWAGLQAAAKQPDIGIRIDRAMAAIERDNPALKGVLPQNYGREDLDNLNVPLRPGAILSGNLVFDGVSRPSSGTLRQARIVVERANTALPGSDPTVIGAVDDVGQFTAAGLAAGFYFVRVTDSPVGWMFRGAMLNGRDLSEHPVEVRNDLAGISIEFTDRWTGLSGIVTTPTGQTDSAALVLLFTTDSSHWRAYTPGARRMRSTRVTASGEFSFSSIPVGDYYLTAIADEDGADWQDPDTLDALSRGAARITIHDGDQKTVTIRRRGSRR